MPGNSLLLRTSSLSSKLLLRQRQQEHKRIIMLRAVLSKKSLVTTAGAAISTTYVYQSYQPAAFSGRKNQYFSTTTTTDCETASSNPNKDPRPYLPPRSEQITRLTKSNTPETAFDVLVVGGGATGSGVALDAATRGLNCALIEKGDFGTETSARSTKLIWAGIRYIAVAFGSLLRWHNFTRPVEALKDFKSEFDMVMGAQKERTLLLENNPHLTNWVPIAVPIHSWVSWPPPFGHILFASAPITLPLVFKAYDAMSGFTCPPSHIMSKARSKRKFPTLDEDAKYFQVFYEGQHNDARTNTYIALTAAEEGACVNNYVEMTDVIHDEEGKAIGVVCKDNLSGKEHKVFAKSIIFCGGPFTDQMRKLEDPDCKPAVQAAAGTHIVLPSYYCPSSIGMLDINTSDGRFLFFLPWEGYTVVGTTDRKGPATSYHGPPEEEIEWILKEVQTYLSDDLKVRRADVLSAWQGFRPLASDPHAPPGAPVSRDHTISTNPKTGITFITGGKWTTYREMAEDVLNRVIEQTPELKAKKPGPCKTAEMSLRGGRGYDRNVPIKLVQKYGVSEDVGKHLAKTYGMYAFDVCDQAKATFKSWPRFGSKLIDGFPYIEEEIAYACRHEMAVSLIDMLTIRTRIAYLNKEAALAVAPKVADIMAAELKWNRFETKRQLQHAQEVLNTFGGRYPNDMTQKMRESLAQHSDDVRAVFKTFDHDNSGYIDFTEFVDVVNALGVPFANEKEARKVFNEIDARHDSKLWEDEFIEWWQSPKSAKFKKSLDERIKLDAKELGKQTGVAFG